MSVFQLDHLRLSVPGQTLLEDATLNINVGERVGIIGRNGEGKTSLLNAIAGQLEPEDGRIVLIGRPTIGVLEQLPEFSAEVKVRDYLETPFAELHALRERMADLEHKMAENPADEQVLEQYGHAVEAFEQGGGYSLQSQIERVAQGLGITRPMFDLPMNALSGGQQTRAAMAKLLLSHPDVLLLDEPTNHLDLEAILWLEGYLAEWEGTVLMVSHDRTMLNRCMETILEVQRGRLEVYRGDYDEYLVEREKRMEAQWREFEKQQKEIKQAEEYIRRNVAGVKARQAKGRRKLLARVEKLDKPTPEDDSLTLSFAPEGRGPKEVIICEEVRYAWEDATLFENLDIRLYRGEKIGLVGPNGSGKSTLLRMILGREAPTSGTVRLGPGVTVGYLDQHMQELDEEITVRDAIWNHFPDLTRQQVMGVLGRFLFDPSYADVKIRALSGGERMRVLLARLMLGGPMLMILDEPTNHLDIPGREVLEDAMADYPGSALIVSHDRYFLDEVVDKIWAIEEKGIRVYEGGWTDYELRRAEWAAQEKVKKETPAKPAPVKPVRNEDEKARKRREKQVKQLEGEIAELEARIAAIETQLSEIPADDWEELTAKGEEKTRIEGELEKKMEAWGELAD